MYIYICTCTSICICICICKCVYVCIHVNVCVCMCIRVRMCISICKCQRTEICARKTNVFENMHVRYWLRIFYEPLEIKLLTSLTTCMGWGCVGYKCPFY